MRDEWRRDVGDEDADRRGGVGLRGGGRGARDRGEHEPGSRSRRNHVRGVHPGAWGEAAVRRGKRDLRLGRGADVRRRRVGKVRGGEVRGCSAERVFPPGTTSRHFSVKRSLSHRLSHESPSIP